MGVSSCRWTASSQRRVTRRSTWYAMRKRLQPKVRAVRKQIKKHLNTASSQEAKQLAVLDNYAPGILTALNTDGLQPFKYATVEASQMLDEIAASLGQLPKKGGP